MDLVNNKTAEIRCASYGTKKNFLLAIKAGAFAAVHNKKYLEAIAPLETIIIVHEHNISIMNREPQWI